MGGTGGFYIGIPGNGGAGGAGGDGTGAAGGAGTFDYPLLVFASNFANIFILSIFGVSIAPPPFAG
jgi:hypothetical protein